MPGGAGVNPARARCSVSPDDVLTDTARLRDLLGLPPMVEWVGFVPDGPLAVPAADAAVRVA